MSDMEINKTILITGASGFIGKSVTTHFVKKGYKIRVLLRNKNKLNISGIEVVEGDMQNPKSLEEATKNIDTVIHLAALKVDEKDSFKTNVGGTKHLIHACKKNNVNYIINISSSSTKIKDKGFYAETKDTADKITIESGVTFTILKPSIVYGDMKNGVFGSLARFANWPITPVVGNGQCLFWPIHVDDLSKIIELTYLQKNTRGKVYDVGGPDTLSINEIIQKISKIIFQKNKSLLIHIPKTLGLYLAKLLKIFLNNPPITPSNVLGSTQDIEWNKEKIFHELNFIPRDFNTGIQQIKSICNKNEAGIFFNYIYSHSKTVFTLSKDLEDKYFKALSNNYIDKKISPLLVRFPFLLGPLDAITKIFYKKCNLQKRLQIASVLTECDIQSSAWLLPQERTKIKLIWKMFTLTVSASIKILCGVLLMIIPGFIQKHAK